MAETPILEPRNNQLSRPKSAMTVPQEKSSRVDPRSKILLLLCVSVILVGGAGGDQVAKSAYLLLAALPMLVLMLEGYWKSGLFLSSLFGFFAWVAITVVPSLEGDSQIAVMGMVVFCTRILPAAASFSLLMTIPVSELVSALYRFKLPVALITVLVIILRFFPCVLSEFVAIERSVRMRGLALGNGSLKTAVFSRLLPFLSNTLRIGDELSAAAISRGLGAKKRRTNYYQTRFSWFDLPILAVIVMNVLLAITSLWVMP
ncbi:energy-coupling factor transporter transmembrane component T [Vibrio sp. LaRot3]|uniref:energy-coupling factor transporter transmembrane component T n=1 Tax=Vibrio sp. LaRot3 TaxID=2998829 RepID=UPI0022CDC72F|nr:energy-coupling factor transporter transmembrane component T [Vibrio sp. LaRot3]MDA0149874.1 energy-coupling factor transporter transmembrane component T [Vibrio sp. LaRot3]